MCRQVQYLNIYCLYTDWSSNCIRKQYSNWKRGEFCDSVAACYAGHITWLLCWQRFNVVLGLNYHILFCLWVCMIMRLKRRKYKFKPRIRLRQNIYFLVQLYFLLSFFLLIYRCIFNNIFLINNFIKLAVTTSHRDLLFILQAW